jgi:hypothetical protein
MGYPKRKCCCGCHVCHCLPPAPKPLFTYNEWKALQQKVAEQKEVIIYLERRIEALKKAVASA